MAVVSIRVPSQRCTIFNETPFWPASTAKADPETVCFGVVDDGRGGDGICRRGLIMELDDVGTVIATRELHIEGSAKVRITIGTPREFPEGDNFFCPFQILGIGNETVRYAGGVDAVQALVLSLQAIGAYLYTSAEFKAGRLTYLGMRNLGFPVPDNIRDLVPDDQAHLPG